MAEKPAEAQEDVSTRDDLLAAFDAVEARGATTETPEPAATEVVEPAEPVESIEDKAEVVEGTEPKPAEVEVKDGVLEPLPSWTQAHKEQFKELPPAAQKIILDRERERDTALNRKFEEIASFRKEYSAVDEMFSPYKAQMAREGFTPYTIIQAWNNVEQELRSGRGADVLKRIADAYKIDPASAFGLSAQPVIGQQPKQEDELSALLKPYLKPYEDKITELQGQVGERRQFEQTYQERQLTETATRIQNDIVSFANAKNDKGELVHPYFKDVEADMARLVTAYRAAGQPVPSFDQLYDNSVWANPSTRERLQSAQRTAAAQSTQQQARVKAVAAKKAGSSVSGTPSIGQYRNGKDNDLSVRASLEAAFDSVAER